MGRFLKGSRRRNMGNGVQKYNHEFILPVSPNHDHSLDDFNKWDGEFSI